MKQLKYILLIIFFLLLGCSTDNLNNTGILGLWEIKFRNLGNSKSNNKLCCQYIEFYPNRNKEDLTGKYVFFDGSKEKFGEFTINEVNNIITFQSHYEKTICEFSIDQLQESLILKFNNDSISLEENWVRLN